MKRRIVVGSVFLLVALLCGGLVWFNFFRDKMIGEFFANMKPPPQTVSALEVKAKTWTPGIVAIGTTRAANGVELAAETAGLVKEIRFKANDRVKAGQIVVQLDDNVERADLLEAESAIKLNQATLERRQTLRERGFNSAASFDEAEASLSTAKSKLAKTQAVIDQKALKAPFAGTIGIPRIDPGQYVQAGTVVATLQNLDSMRVDFTVPEQMAGHVKIGQAVRFGLGESDLPLAGKITGIDPRVDPQTRLIAVQALLDGKGTGDLMPGQFVHARVELPAEPNVVTVPQTAAVTSLYGDYVFIIEKNNGADTAKQVFVKLGRRNGSELEITSGLKPGQTVVVAGQNKLQPGAAVKIDNSVDLQRIAETERRLTTGAAQ